jgi:hypothetical protein
MSKYQITAPDGSNYEITAPDDASEDQVLAYAQEQWKAKTSEVNVPRSTNLNVKSSSTETNGASDENNLLLRQSAAAEPKALPSMPRGLYEGMAQDASIDSGAAPKNDLPELYQDILGQRQVAKTELPALRRAEITNSSPGLYEAPTGNMAMPPLSSGRAQAPSVSRLARFGRGLYDIPQAGSQFLQHALPRSFIDRGNELVGKANELPIIGPLTKAAGIVPETPEQYDQKLTQQEQAYQQARQQAAPRTTENLITGKPGDPGMDWMRLGGNIVATAPVAARLPVAAGRGLLARTAAGAATGGILGSLQPVYGEGNFASKKGTQAGVGAAIGGLMVPITTAASRIIQPKVDPNVQALMKEGVVPTPGQVLGGAAAKIEDKLMSIPLLGDAIAAGRNRANQQLNRAAINRALEPIGQKLPAGMTGREAIGHAGKQLGDAYDDVLARIGAVVPDQQFGQDMTSLSAITQNLPKDKGDQFARILQNEVFGRVQNGAMTSDGLKAAESNLGQIARNYARSPDYDQRVLGDAITQAQANLRSMLERQAPQFSQELKAINRGWATFLRPQRASAMLGAEEGSFTSAQLQNAVKALDSTRNKGAFARGKALLQDLSEPAKAVMNQKVPNSGTADRTFLGLLGAGGLGYVSPMALLGGGASSLLYTPAGQRAAAALLTQRPAAAAPLAGLLMRSAPAISAGGAVAAPGLLNQ